MIKVWGAMQFSKLCQQTRTFWVFFLIIFVVFVIWFIISGQSHLDIQRLCRPSSQNIVKKINTSHIFVVEKKEYIAHWKHHFSLVCLITLLCMAEFFLQLLYFFKLFKQMRKSWQQYVHVNFHARMYYHKPPGL